MTRRNTIGTPAQWADLTTEIVMSVRGAARDKYDDEGRVADTTAGAFTALAVLSQILGENGAFEEE
jgi:hypothetical protein